jgi:hypothetical protein
MLGSTAYHGLCEQFVERAYGTSGRYASALSAFYALRNSGMMHYNSTGIPAGALVFDRNPYDGGYGHVIISRGDGTFVSPQSTVRLVYSPSLGYPFLG